VQRVAPAGRKPDFWPVNKFNTGSLPLRGILPVMTEFGVEAQVGKKHF